MTISRWLSNKTIMELRVEDMHKFIENAIVLFIYQALTNST